MSQANCFITHKKLTMYPLGKLPFAPSETGPTDDHMDLPCGRQRENDGRTAWSNDGDDRDKRKPDSEQPDQEAVRADSEDGSDLMIPIEFDMEALQLGLAEREDYPSPNNLPGSVPRGIRNHYDGSKLKDMLANGDTFTRKMSFQHGTRKIYKRDLESYTVSNERPQPLGLSYAPVPYVVPNGMMSALDIFPYAKDDTRRESYFIAYGVTLATENRFGKTVYYNGDANIRISEPFEGVTIDIPNHARTDLMRQQMFRMGKYKPRKKKKRIQKDQVRCTRSQNGNSMVWNIMERDELEAVLDHLVDNPMDDEDLRTYSLTRRSDGIIEVRPDNNRHKGPQRTCDPDRDSTSLEKKDKEISNRDADPIRTAQDILTGLGRDPQTPDQASIEGRMDRNVRSPANRQGWSDTQGAAPPGNDLSNAGLVLVEEEESIKERNLLSKTVPCLECSTRDLANTDTLTDGQYPQTPCQSPRSNLDGTQAQDIPGKQVSRAQKDLAGLPPVLRGPFEDSSAGGEWSKHTARGMEGPGLLAAAHLVELREEQLPPGERSFAAFNAIIVAGLEQGFPLSHHGHAYIRLYSSRSEVSTGRPPTPDWTAVRATNSLDHAREYLEKIHMMPKPKDDPWDSFLRRNQASLRNPLRAISDLSIRNERDEEMAIEDAVDGLRTLKNEIRFEDEAKVTAKEEGKRLLYSESVAILNNGLADEGHTSKSEVRVKDEPKTPERKNACKWLTEEEIDEILNEGAPDDLRGPPIPVKYDRTVHKLLVDDLQKLPAMLQDPAFFEGPAKETSDTKVPNHSLWYPEDIPVRDRHSFRNEEESVLSKKIPSPAVKVETEEIVLTESPTKISKPTDPPPCELVSKEDPMTDVRRALDDVPSSLPDLETTPSTEEGEIVAVSNPQSNPGEVVQTIDRVITNLELLMAEVEQTQEDDTRMLIDSLASYGLLQVVQDLAKAKTEGRDLGQAYWEERVANALKEQELYDERLASVRVDSKDATAEEEPCKVSLMVRKEEDEDIEMITHLESVPDDKPVPPRPPVLPVEWYPDVEVPPYVPLSPVSNDGGERYVPKSPELPQLVDIRLQVSELEDRVEESNADLQRRVKQLEDQVYIDGCLLTELKWKQGELKKQENWIWTNRKKTSRRNAPNPPSHRYPTRYSTGNMDSRLAKTKQSIEDVVERIGKLEKRVEETNGEIGRLKSKIDQVLALAPRLEDLSKILDEHRKTQGDTNSVVLSEIATIRNTTAPELRAQIKNNTLEIATLQQNYQQLYTLAASLLYSAQTSGYNSRNNHSNYFPLNNVPERKAVTVF